MNITDEMLYEAAPEAAERWLGTLPERGDCGHEFSLTFQAAMEPLLRRRRRRWRTLILLAAVIAALAGLLALGVSAGRPDDYGVYAAQENGYASYLLRPKNDSFEQAIHPLTPDWVPEGFARTSVTIQEDYASARYSHRSQNQGFTLSQWHGKETASTLMGHYEVEDVLVDGNNAIFLSAPEEPVTYLLWTQGADAFVLCVNNLEQRDIIHIAESLKW